MASNLEDRIRAEGIEARSHALLARFFDFPEADRHFSALVRIHARNLRLLQRARRKKERK